MSLKLKVLLVGIVTTVILGFLAWEHFNGGVKSHHLLNKRDLPAISNWWGILLLPLLTWFLLGRVEKRLEKQTAQPTPTDHFIRKSLGLFFTGLLLGIAISIAFTNQYKPFLDNVLYVLLALSLIMPIFYAEFVLGFIIGMTFTFGAMLPTAFILIVALFGWIMYNFLRPLLLRLVAKTGRNKNLP